MSKSELVEVVEVIGSMVFLTALFGLLYVALWIVCPC